MKRCIESGLWVPNSRTDDVDEKGEDGIYEEVKQEQEETKKEWPTLILWFDVYFPPLYCSSSMCMTSLPIKEQWNNFSNIFSSDLKD